MSSILDHVGLKVADFDKAIAFYREVLGTLGIKVLTDGRKAVASAHLTRAAVVATNAVEGEGAEGEGAEGEEASA